MPRHRSQAPPPVSAARRRDKRHLDELLDEALEQTFPASDPVALTEPVLDHVAARAAPSKGRKSRAGA